MVHLIVSYLLFKHFIRLIDVYKRQILRSLSLEWNILNKLFPGRKVPRGRTESAVPPLDSTLALLLRAAPGLWCGGVY